MRSSQGIFHHDFGSQGFAQRKNAAKMATASIKGCGASPEGGKGSMRRRRGKPRGEGCGASPEEKERVATPRRRRRGKPRGKGAEGRGTPRGGGGGGGASPKKEEDDAVEAVAAQDDYNARKMFFFLCMRSFGNFSLLLRSILDSTYWTLLNFRLQYALRPLLMCECGLLCDLFLYICSKPHWALT